MENSLFYIAPAGSVIALLFAWIFYRMVMKYSEGTDQMRDIAASVREGASAFLRRQYSVVTLVFIVIMLILAVLAYFGVQNMFVPVAFLTGGFFSGLCGYLGMKMSTNASARTANGASSSLNLALKIAFRSGAVMGLVVVGFGLLDIALWYMVLNYIYDHNVWNLGAELAEKIGMVTALGEFNMEMVQLEKYKHAKLVEITTVMITFAMGASTQALFARVGGGIYTKAADVGADMVGKVEENIPEDDPRNPATIADNVGDNVGDVAGMGADLYESYCDSILATMSLGAALPLFLPAAGLKAVIAPMVIAGLAIVFSIAGIFAVRTSEEVSMKNLMRSLNTGIWGASVLVVISLAVMAYTGFITWGIFGAVIAGLAAGLVIGWVTEYYTSDEYHPTRHIAEQSQTGAATNIIDGFSTGMLSSGFPVLAIVVGIVAAFGLAGGFQNVSMGLYGVGFASVGLLSTLGITLATDAYGPIADNAGGNVEMNNLPPEVRERTDALDQIGNTTAATGKGFAIGSAALTALALLSAYLEEVRLWIGKLAHQSTQGFFQVGKVKFYNMLPEGISETRYDVVARTAEVGDFMRAYDVTLMNPLVIGGLFLGAIMAFVFSALCMKAVGRSANEMINEVRRQFREKPGILEGKEKPDYARCVEISTRGAQKEMILPSLLAVIIPVLTGLVFGVPGVLGLLAGGLTGGFALACTLNNAGGAWDNAKKFIEKGNYGGKNSDAHAAGVIGDTVGDPFKDTAGPSLNILIKLMTIVSVVFTGVVVKFSPVIKNWLGFM